MSQNLLIRSRIPAVATACLMSVALPASAVVAKEKTKPAASTQAEMNFDYAVSIPTIDANGSNLPDSVLADVLSGNVADHAQALADLDATSIAVPEIILNITSQLDGEQYDTVLTFTNLRLENVIDGRAAQVSLGGMYIDTAEGTFDFGTMSASNFDIAGILGLYGLVDSDQTELEVIYTDLVTEGGNLVSDEVSCTIGSIRAAEFKARPLKTPLVEIMAVAQAMEDDPESADPALVGQFLKMYADILTAFETSEITFDGMTCTGTDDEDRDVNFSLAGMTMGGMSPGVYPPISIDGFSMEVEGDGSVLLDNFTIKAMDLSATIAVLENAPDRIDEVWFEQNARALFPAMEGLSFAGLDIDVPDPESPTTRVQAKVGSFDLSLAAYLNGIPTDIDLSASNIAAEIPADSGDENLDQLRALGITSIDAGFRVAAAWNEETSSIGIKEVSFTGVDLATVLLAGTIANATEDLFSLDMDAALMASMAVAVKNLDLTVTDAGLTDIIISIVAAEQGADPATLRPVFAGLAQGTVIAMLAGAADAAKLGEAINRFVAGNAKTLAIGIEAKSDPGLGMMDFMEAEEDPTTLLGKVNISAEAK